MPGGDFNFDSAIPGSVSTGINNQIALRMTDTSYFQFLRLPAHHRTEPLYTGVSHNNRRAYLINYNPERGEFIYAERRALLGFSEERPPWRTLDSKKAATLDGLLELIDPKIVKIMGVPCQRLAA